MKILISDSFGPKTKNRLFPIRPRFSDHLCIQTGEKSLRFSNAAATDVIRAPLTRELQPGLDVRPLGYFRSRLLNHIIQNGDLIFYHASTPDYHHVIHQRQHPNLIRRLIKRQSHCCSC